MLRWVARALRVVLFALGISVLLWFPLSFRYQTSVGWRNVVVYSEAGAMDLWCWDLETLQEALRTDLRARVGRRTFPPGLEYPSTKDALFPRIDDRLGEFDDILITIPLWLLAVVCLAWPVTSFLLARRRRGRGFEVEAHPRSEVIDAV